MLTVRSLAIAAAVGILITTLTGCAVSVTDPDTDTTQESAVETEPQEAVASDEDAPDDAEDGPVNADSGPTEWSAEVGEARDEKLASVMKTVTCDGDLVLGDNETGQVIQIEGPCEHLVLDMHGGFVVAGEITTLDIRGVGNAVFVDAVTTLNVTGDGGAVYWLGPTPAVNDSGAGNVLTAG
ncbi:DUF3060 domain-containing protein [Microbacterium sp. A84]|uniref:DUF3060 domain-containing protein n=1 Tax=Microbacterium sp. A84 TaxID=3450715 RepID=UPI003F43544F